MVDAIDRRNTTQWAMKPVSDKAYVALGYATFLLLNRATWREHKLYLTGFGPAISASLKSSKWGNASDYKSFDTKRAVSFQDFDQGNTVMLTIGSIGLGIGYSYTKLRIWDGAAFLDPELAVVTMKGAVAMAGFKVKASTGFAKLDYGNGVPSKQAKGQVARVLQHSPPDPKTEPHPGRVRVDAQENPRIELPADTLFRFGKATLNGNAEESLARALLLLNDRKLRGPVHVEGHTDSVGGEDYNLRLSKRRAEAVGNWFKLHGVLAPEDLVITGHGESKPIEENTIDGKDNPDGRKKNRRVTIHYKVPIG